MLIQLAVTTALLWARLLQGTKVKIGNPRLKASPGFSPVIQELSRDIAEFSASVLMISFGNSTRCMSRGHTSLTLTIESFLAIMNQSYVSERGVSHRARIYRNSRNAKNEMYSIGIV